MAQDLSDTQRVLKLIERTRLLVAIDDDMPTETKLNTQPMLKMLENELTANSVDERRASGYYSALYTDLAPYPDLEALLSAMRVFLPFL
jgi:hypothetical protein